MRDKPDDAVTYRFPDGPTIPRPQEVGGWWQLYRSPSNSMGGEPMSALYFYLLMVRYLFVSPTNESHVRNHT